MQFVDALFSVKAGQNSIFNSDKERKKEMISRSIKCIVEYKRERHQF